LQQFLAQITQRVFAWIMASVLLEHIQAAKSFLDSMKGQSCYDDCLAAQKGHIETTLAGITLGVREASKIVDACKSLPFSPDTLSELLRLVGAKTSHALLELSNPGKLVFQNYEAILNYFTKEHWVAWSSMDDDEMFDDIAKHAISIMLKVPTENTHRVLATIHLAIKKGGVEAAMRLSAFEKNAAVKASKRHFKKMLKTMPPVSVWVPHLPERPADFRRAYPRVCEVAYANTAPFPCPVPPQMLLALAASVPCRSSKKELRADAAHEPNFSQSMVSRGASPTLTIQQTMQLFFSMIQGGNMGNMMQGGNMGTGFKEEIEILKKKTDSTLVRGADGSPAHGSPAHDSPAHSSPAHDSPAHGTPADGQKGNADDPSKKLPRHSADEALAIIKAARDKVATTTKAAKSAKNKEAAAKGAKAEKGKEAKAAKPAKEAAKPATVAVEWSRDQVLARTGAKGAGQSKAFKFGKLRPYGTVDAAKAAATKWIKSR
jgi:hypothetical protein